MNKINKFFEFLTERSSENKPKYTEEELKEIRKKAKKMKVKKEEPKKD